MSDRTITLALLVDFLEKEGQGCNLISDDDGRWAVSTSGHQPVITGKHAQTFQTVSWVEPNEWRPTIREALLAFWKMGHERKRKPREEEEKVNAKSRDAKV